MLAALVMASGLIFEVGVVAAATNAHHGFGHAKRCVGDVRERRGGPFPDIADELVDAADTGAAGELVDGNRRAVAGTVEMRAADVERFAPRVPALGDAAGRGFDRPSGGF